MGMFDYLTHEGVEYQTKDTPDQYMSSYRIVNGRLLGEEWHMETVPKAERTFPDAADDSPLALCGCMRRVIDKADVDQNWHGYLYAIGDGPDYPEYRAKFTDGNLVEWLRLPAGAEDA